MGCSIVVSRWPRKVSAFSNLCIYSIFLQKSLVANGNDKCLQPVQVTSMTYVCSHPIWYNVFHTMLYNCIYEIIQCCSPPLLTLSIKLYNVAKNSTPYTTNECMRTQTCGVTINSPLFLALHLSVCLSLLPLSLLQYSLLCLSLALVF